MKARRHGEGDGGQHGAEVEIHGPLQLVVEGRLDGADRFGASTIQATMKPPSAIGASITCTPWLMGMAGVLASRDHHHQVGEQQDGVIDVALQRAVVLLQILMITVDEEVAVAAGLDQQEDP